MAAMMMGRIPIFAVTTTATRVGERGYIKRGSNCRELVVVGVRWRRRWACSVCESSERDGGGGGGR